MQKRFAFVFFLILFCFFLKEERGEWGSSQVYAQTTSVASRDSKTIRVKLDRYRALLDEKEKVLSNGLQTDEDLVKLRDQLQTVVGELQSLSRDIDPRMEALKQRLDQLGPKPADNTTEESADVAQERTSRQSAVTELEELQKITAALSVQAQQLLSLTVEQRRSLFTQSIFKRSYSVLSPLLWRDFFISVGEDLKVTQNVFVRWGEVIQNNISFWSLLLLTASFLIGILLLFLRRYLKKNWVDRDSAVSYPPIRSRIFASCRLLVADILPVVLFFYGFSFLLEQLKLYPPPMQATFDAVYSGILLIIVARSLNNALTSPRDRKWQILPMGEIATQRFKWFSTILYSLISIKLVLDTFYKSITASIPLTLVTHAGFTVLAASLVLPILRSEKDNTVSLSDDSSSEEKHHDSSTLTGVLRTIGWVVLIVICFSLLFGYISLADFLLQEAGGILLTVGFMYFLVILIDETIYGTLKRDDGLSVILQNNLGLQKKSLEQFGVISSGLLKFIIITLICMFLLARLRIDSSDIVEQVQTAFYGFKVGDISISPSSLMTSLAIILIGLVLTRMIRNWLANTYFPVTNLDAGVRNSILTMCGYIGTGITLILALSSVGLSLDRVAIVAGALSVGIGFGLQSIVNNFVSGLILLWERPIRVGDWVSVGGEEGYVRNIKVRATEIQTFDRATVIVPNSSLISGVVVNNVRLTRMRRVSILIPLPRYADADAASQIMRTCALAHLEVMSQPAANIYFRNISETAIELQLVCFVEDVDAASRVGSELRFSIFRELRQAGLLPTTSGATRIILDQNSETVLTRAVEPYPSSIEKKV